MNSKSHKQLNKLQLEVLLFLYKFRFGTSELIASYQEKSIRYTNIRLSILLEQGFIGRNYDSSYRINRRPATYYLLPKAIQLLKFNEALDKKGLHLLYYNRSANPKFINHCLDLIRIYLKLKTLYQENLEFFTSTEIADQSQFPKPLLDGFLRLKNKANNNSYFIELLDHSSSYTLLKKKVNKHLRHYELEKLEGDYPTILLICSSKPIETMIIKYLSTTLNKKGINELQFLIATKDQLLSGLAKSQWLNVLEDNEIITP